MNMDKARRVVMLKLLKKHYEDIAERLGGEVNKLSTELYEEFNDDDVESIRISPIRDGKLIFSDNRERIVTPDLKYKSTIQDQAKLFQWLRAKKCGELIKESVHPSTLEAFITDLKEKNKEVPPVTALTIYDFKTVKVTMAQAPKTKLSKGE